MTWHKTDLAKVAPGDGDSVGDTGEMQPGSDVYRSARTTWFNTRLIGWVIALLTQQKVIISQNKWPES